MSVSTVKLNGTTLMTVSDTTAVASDVGSGKYFYAKDGTKTAGSASGGSSWNKIVEDTVTLNTTSTSATLVKTWSTGSSSIWTPNKILYVRVRDTAGKRNGYFYGSDSFLLNKNAYNAASDPDTSRFIRYFFWFNSSGILNDYFGSNTTGYGYYPLSLSDDGTLAMYSKYSSSYTGTINGTYKAEVYLLDPAGSVLPFGT